MIRQYCKCGSGDERFHTAACFAQHAATMAEAAHGDNPSLDEAIALAGYSILNDEYPLDDWPHMAVIVAPSGMWLATPERLIDGAQEQQRERIRFMVTAANAALRAQSGDALVPREPTEAMIKAAEIMAERHDNRGLWIPKFWRAMYDAALAATQGKA